MALRFKDYLLERFLIILLLDDFYLVFLLGHLLLRAEGSEEGKMISCRFLLFPWFLADFYDFIDAIFLSLVGSAFPFL